MDDDSVKKQKAFILALDIFDNEEQALSWFTTPIPTLGNRKPVDLLDSTDGEAAVRNVLKKMLSGEYS